MRADNENNSLLIVCALRELPLAINNFKAKSRCWCHRAWTDQWSPVKRDHWRWPQDKRSTTAFKNRLRRRQYMIKRICKYLASNGLRENKQKKSNQPVIHQPKPKLYTNVTCSISLMPTNSMIWSPESSVNINPESSLLQLPSMSRSTTSSPMV